MVGDRWASIMRRPLKNCGEQLGGNELLQENSHSPLETEEFTHIWAVYIARLRIDLALTEKMYLHVRKRHINIIDRARTFPSAYPFTLVQFRNRIIDGMLKNPLPTECLDHLSIPEELGEKTIWQTSIPS